MVALFFIVAGIVVLAILIQMQGSDVVPWSCPSCMHGGDRNVLGTDTNRWWYERVSETRVRCWHCGKHFREHPDGSFVEDR